MSITKEEIKTIGYKILEDLKVTNYYTDREPIIKKEEILVITGENSSKKEDGWGFIIGAPNWQFDNDQGLYAISFFLDGIPHRISDVTGGQGISVFVYKDAAEDKYKAVATVAELPK